MKLSNEFTHSLLPTTVYSKEKKKRKKERACKTIVIKMPVEPKVFILLSSLAGHLLYLLMCFI